jgi:hypothetical protein
MAGRRAHRFLAVTLVSLLAWLAVPLQATAAPVDFDDAKGAPKIGLIGDSTMAGVRWTERFDELRRYRFFFSAESCRRTVGPSCRGREGFVPSNGITALERMEGRFDTALVVMLGYNDGLEAFTTGVDAIVAEAARQGIRHVVWLSLRTHTVRGETPRWVERSATYLRMNRVLAGKADEHAALVVADWAAYSAAHPEWTYADGLHLTPAGAGALTSFIAAEVDAVLAAGTPETCALRSLEHWWQDLGPGETGAKVAVAQRALASAGVASVGPADGVFGEQTEAAVRQFQAERGLSATGRIDTDTAVELGIAQHPPRPDCWWEELDQAVTLETVLALPRLWVV